eukprot:g6078.t1
MCILLPEVVILIFSVSKSGAFQGYARMRSLPGQSKCKSDPFGGFGRLFDVEWLRLQDVVMPEVSYLRNPLDEGRQVTAARDGQELSYQVGAELCTHFDVRVYLEDPKNYEPCMVRAQECTLRSWQDNLRRCVARIGWLLPIPINLRVSKDHQEHEC